MPSSSRLVVVLDQIRALRSVIEARAAEAEQARRLPVELVAQLKAAQLFRLFVPRAYGGLELDLVDGMEAIEALARVDAAVAWTAMIGAQSAHLFAVLPRAEVDRIYAAGPDVIAAGAMAPQGRAQPRAGGYVVDGRWSFATGCQHSDWLYGNCVVAGERAPRTMVFPARAGRVVDNWHVLGMRASGSHDIAVEAVFVPDAYTFNAAACTASVPGPSFVAPPLHIHLQLASIATGLAQGAIEDLIAIAASGKKRLYSSQALAESPCFHREVAAAQAAARAARASVRELASRFWRACLEQPDTAGGFASEVLGTTSWVVRSGADVVTACYRASGSSAIRDGASLQRRFRDAHTLTQHIAATDDWLTQMGAAALGRPVHVA